MKQASGAYPPTRTEFFLFFPAPQHRVASSYAGNVTTLVTERDRSRTSERPIEENNLLQRKQPC